MSYPHTLEKYYLPTHMKTWAWFLAQADAVPELKTRSRWKEGALILGEFRWNLTFLLENIWIELVDVRSGENINSVSVVIFVSCDNVIKFESLNKQKQYSSTYQYIILLSCCQTRHWAVSICFNSPVAPQDNKRANKLQLLNQACNRIHLIITDR